jgi:WD40 repeat protein
VYWSPVTGQLAASSERGLQFYNADLSLEAKRLFEDSTSSGAIFSPNMKYAGIVEARGLIVRDTTTWEPILALDSSAGVAWSPDSTMLALWSGGILQVWDVSEAVLLREFTELISEGAVAPQWSPDGEVLAIPTGATIAMINIRSGDVVRIHDFAKIAAFEWSRDGRWLVIAGLPDALPLDYDPANLVPYSLIRLDALTGDIVTTYDISSGDETFVYSVNDYVSISPNGRYVSAYAYRAISVEDPGWLAVGMMVFDLETGKRLSLADSPSSPVLFDCAYTSWSPDGSRFATSTANTLQIYEIASGQLVADLPAYINVTNQTVWTNDGAGLVAAGGLWDVTGEFPQYLYSTDVPTPREDRYVGPRQPSCSLYNRAYCPAYMVPDPLVFDYDRPPYEWELIQWMSDRALAVSYEIDIEYPDTPEYEDDEPPEERYVIWDTSTGERMDERVYLGLQTAWVYDIDGAPTVESESRAFNIRRNTYFIGIGDDEIVDLREETITPLQNVNIWEWREVWFSPEGRFIVSYDTDGRFKVFDPFTGVLLYQTVATPRDKLWYTADLTLTFVQDAQSTLYIYDSTSGDLLLETYTANVNPLLLWNKDRSRLAIGGDNRAIIIYDVAEQKRLGILRGHTSAISSMAWNPACDYAAMSACRYVFASSDQSGEVILWGTERRDQLAAAMPEAPSPPVYDLPVADIDFASLTPVWSYVTLTDEYGRSKAQTVRWADAGIQVNQDAYYTAQFEALDAPQNSAAWIRPTDVTADGRMVANSGLIYDSEGRVLSQVTSGQVADAAFDPLGTRVVTAEDDTGQPNTLSGWIKEYSAESGQFIEAWGGGNPGFDSITYSPDKRWIATTTLPYNAMGARVQIWFADRFNTQFSSLIGHTQPITSLYWDGEDVLTSSLDGTVRRWDIRTGWPLARWDHPAHAPVTQMDWIDAQRLLVSAADDLYVLDAATLEVRRTIAGVGGGQFDWSPDRTRVTVIGSDSIIRIVDLSSGDTLADETEHMPAIAHLEWNPSGETLVAVRDDGSLVLLDGLTGEMRALLRPHGPVIRSLAWNPDGTSMLLDLIDGPIQIIDGSDGTLRAEIDNPWRRAGVWWSPDGTRIAYGTYPDPTDDPYNAQSLLNIHSSDGALIGSFDLNWSDYIFYWDVKPFTLSWSPDAAYIAAFYQNGVRVWDTASGALVSNHLSALNLADPDHERYPNGRPPDDPRISLAVWQEDMLYFWRPDSAWSLDRAADVLQQESAEGLPYGTRRRADGQVLLADSVVVHADSNYSLQRIVQTYVDGAWHPSCWTQDCPAVLAVAHGSTVTLFGYEAPQ